MKLKLKKRVQSSSDSDSDSSDSSDDEKSQNSMISNQSFSKNSFDMFNDKKQSKKDPI